MLTFVAKPAACAFNEASPAYNRNIMTYLFENESIEQRLLQLAERGNPDFTRKLHPGVEGVLGIRVPDLRALARRIARSADIADYLAAAEAEVAAGGSPFMEGRTLHGMVLGYVRPMPADVYLKHVALWVPSINSWSVCDAFKFADGKDFVARHEKHVWDFSCEWLGSEREYEVRFGVLCLMQYFIDSAHVEEVLRALSGVIHEGYYARMAVAWATAECYVRFPHDTLPVLENGLLPAWTHNKTLQKICESLRPTGAVKERLKVLKRKVKS